MHKYHVTLSRGRSCLLRNWLKYLRMQKRNNFTKKTKPLSTIVYVLACSKETSIGYLEQFILVRQKELTHAKCAVTHQSPSEVCNGQPL